MYATHFCQLCKITICWEFKKGQSRYNLIQLLNPLQTLFDTVKNIEPG